MCSAISTPGAVQLRVDPARPDGDDDVQRHRHERRRVDQPGVGHLRADRADAGRQRRLGNDDGRRDGELRRRSFAGPSRLAAPSGRVGRPHRRPERRRCTGSGRACRIRSIRSPSPRRRHGGFGAPTSYPAGDRPIEGVLVDLNLDGRLDLALEGLSDAFVLFGNGSGGFAAPTCSTRSRRRGQDVRTGDFNADGRPDLVVAVLDTSSLCIMTGRQRPAGSPRRWRFPLPGRGPPDRRRRSEPRRQAGPGGRLLLVQPGNCALGRLRLDPARPTAPAGSPLR